MKGFYKFWWITGLSLLAAGHVLHSQTIVPTQSDEIIIDNGGSGKADPGDRIRYKVTIQNTGSGDGTNVQLNVVPDPRTTFVPGTFRSSPLAINDAYPCTGNVGINVPAASGLLSNDFDDNSGMTPMSATAGTFATTGGGSIMIAADGGFMYTPPAGFIGSDTYTYTLNDGNPVGAPVPATDMAMVTITVSNMVWFVSNIISGTGGTGTRLDPFKTIADFNAASGPAAGHTVYLQYTGTDYPGGIVLKNDMRLFGTGHTGGVTLADVLPFAVAPHSFTLPAIGGTAPVITNAAGDGVGLAQNNTLRGLDVGACSDFGMENLAAGTVGNLTISEVTINNTSGGGFKAANGGALAVTFGGISAAGGTNGINLSGSCTGTFAGGTGAISNPSGEAVLINGGTVAVDYDGTLSKTGSSGGRLISIQAHSGGAISLDGNLTNTATGAQGIFVNSNSGGTISFNGTSKTFTTGGNGAISLTTNTGATINFTGSGLAITTTSGTGFNATGGGTVTVTGTGNTINSTSGATALNVVSTNIGASGLNFQSITSTGGTTPGINLNTTGTSGGLSVSGDGGGSNNGSGGSITNKTGASETTGTPGIRLFNTAKVNLRYMNISGCNHSGIYGGSVSSVGVIDPSTINGLQLARCNISGNGNDGGNNPDESGIQVYNLIGSAIGGANPTSLVNCVISNNKKFEASIVNNAGTLTDFQVNNTSFFATGASGGHGDLISMLAYGTANMKINVANSSFVGTAPNTGGGVYANAENSSTVTCDVTGSAFVNNNVATTVATSSGGTANFNINNNMATGNRSHALNVFVSATSPFTGAVNGRFEDNVVGTLGVPNSGSEIGIGIRLQNEGAVPMNILVDGNTVQEIQSFQGINVNLGLGGATTGGNTTNLTITNNVIREIDGSRGLAILDNQNAPNTPAPTICANISGNSFSNIVGQAGNGEYMRVRELNGVFNVTQLMPTAANTATELDNANGFTNPALIDVSGGVSFNQATCPLPNY